MKKIVNITLCLLLISFLCLMFFVSCKSHDHKFGEWSVILEPTCSEEGKQERTCECGEKETEAIAPLPHTESEWVEEVAATVMKKGFQTSYCTVCHAPLARVIPRIVTEDLAYKVNPDGKTCTVTGRRSWVGTELGIPEEIDGYKVTAIADDAFAIYLPWYTHIYIPEGVTHIGANAIKAPYIYLSLPNSLEYMGDGAVMRARTVEYNTYDCGQYIGNEENPYLVFVGVEESYFNITSLEIHPDTRFIAKEAFRYCRNLESVIVPDGVVQIGSYAFMDCKSLSYVKLPESLTEISEGMFSGCTNLSRLEIKNKIKQVGNKAFWGCAALDYVKFSDGLESIGENAFYGCESLQFALLPDSLKAIGESAFAGCKNLQDVIIPQGVETIEANTFARCTNLKRVFVPEGVKTIKREAFSTCSSLEELFLPDSLEVLEIGALYGVDKLSLNEYEYGYYIGNFNNPYLVFIKYKQGSPSNFKIHDNTKFINEGAFRGFDSLCAIELPEGLLQIGADAFVGCNRLSEINWPESLRYIGNSAFLTCYSLEDVTFGMNVSYIGENAFKDCTSIKNVSISGNILKIEWGSFYGNTELKQLDIAEGVQIIGEYSFNDCKKAETINIPKSVKEIGSFAFAYTTQLKEINYNGTKAQWQNIKKCDNWDWAAGSYTVHCTDGDIEQ